MKVSQTENNHFMVHMFCIYADTGVTVFCNGVGNYWVAFLCSKVTLLKMSVSGFITYYIKVSAFIRELKEPCYKMRIKFCTLLWILAIFLGFTVVQLHRQAYMWVFLCMKSRKYFNPETSLISYRLIQFSEPKENRSRPTGNIPYWADSAPYLIEPLDTHVLRYQIVSLGCFQMYSYFEYGVHIAVGVGMECLTICSQK